MESKFYYIVFMEFITPKRKPSLEIRNRPPVQSMVKYNSVVTDSHPFLWKGKMLKDKDPEEYMIHITWWKEVTEEEYQMVLALELELKGENPTEN